MAFIQVSFMSKTLMRTVPLQVILPVDKFTFGQPEREEKPFKTLYLLHGIFGNETDWVDVYKRQGIIPLSADEFCELLTSYGVKYTESK